MNFSSKNKKKMLPESINSTNSTNSTSIFSTNKDKVNIIKEKTLDDQMNNIFSKYSNIKNRLNKLNNLLNITK